MRSAAIEPTEGFSLVIEDIAPDKSISHRSAIFALLAEGKSTIENYLLGEDTLHTLSIVANLGAKVLREGATVAIEADGIKESFEILDCGNSGTGMRLFCGLLSGAKGHFVLTGDRYLRSRPMKRIVEPLRSIGAQIDGREDGEYAPLCIRGGHLEGFSYHSPIASAQVKSAMILAALQASFASSFYESSLSRDHTERMLVGMGAKLTKPDALTTYIEPLARPLKPLSLRIPADPSSAFFFAVAAAIIDGGDVTLKGLTLNPTRIEAYRVLERMGARVEYHLVEDRYEPIGDIRVRHAPLRGVEVSSNIAWLIDELPALAIAMACAKGESRVSNAKELRVKESDRIATVVEGLRACGIEAKEHEDGYAILGGRLQRATINSHGDHRVAMSFAVAGLCSGMEIEDVGCVDTSFPNFFELLSKIADVQLANKE